MPNIIEHGLIFCKECQETTKQRRNLKKSSILGLCMHVCAIIITWGFWLIPLGLYKWKESNTPWICKGCGTVN